MILKEEMNKVSPGATFKRCDLHIHSYGQNGSKDVTDINMTIHNIIETAIKENLDIICITDHNSIKNVEDAINYAKGKQIEVIPGVEIATIQGHFLFYFPTFKDLNNFFGKLDFSSNMKICNKGAKECLDITAKYSGFGIAAHIEKDSGFEKTIPKYNPFKEEILKHKNLLGIEISDHKNISWFSCDDNNVNRRKLFELRKKTLEKEEDYELAKVMFSDAHSLKQLGTNAAGNKKLTRIKVDEFSFASLKIALFDPISRIRIEELIPSNIPHFTGVKIEGGFLKDHIIRLSKNLTCIIGGRGAGKSTLLESIRVASGNPSESGLVDSEVWPEKISLIYQDETGKEHVFIREVSNEVRNVTDPMDGILNIPIESYGQGETASKIQNCDKDPGILLFFFDEFIELEDLKFQESELRQKLFDNQSQIEQLSIDIKGIPELEKLKKDTDSKIRILKDQKVGELVKYEENLVKGREFRSSLIEDLNTLIKTIKESFADKTLYEEVIDLDDSVLIIGKEQFKKIKERLIAFFKDIEETSIKLNEQANALVKELRTYIQEWRNKEVEITNKIDQKKKELEKKGIHFDMVFIRKVTQDAESFKTRLNKFYRKRQQLKVALKDRKELVAGRRKIKHKIFQKRLEWSININNVLKGTVVDYLIKVKFKEGLLSQDLQEFIKDAMAWRTSQVPKARIIAENVSPMQLLDGVCSKDLSILKSLKDMEGRKLFTQTDVQNILITLDSPANISRLENIKFEDFPEIMVTRFVVKPDGTKTHHVRNFIRLSLGQRQSIILAILLYSKSTYPLIIDQPEDNLDSEFIYKTIVRNLKRIKENRQVIIVTHNANIAVLGDSELIIPLKSTSERAFIVKRGSIDNDHTKKITCNILEGGKQAFEKRMEIYGLV